VGEIREIEPTASEGSMSQSSGNKVQVFCQEGTLDRGLFVFFSKQETPSMPIVASKGLLQQMERTHMHSCIQLAGTNSI